jgi:Tfp pilus assembly protein PilF/TolB-like protein
MTLTKRLFPAVVVTLCIFLAAGCSYLPLLTKHTIKVPKTPPANSLAVFCFRPSGDADAKLYAIGFPRALADRLHCAPTCVTLQPSTGAVSQSLWTPDHKVVDFVPDKAARDAAASLGVRYYLTGDVQVTGGNVNITACLFDRSNVSRKPVLKVSGKPADLPSMQAALVDQVVKAMDLRPRGDQARELATPNFTKADTLRLYAQSYQSKDLKKSEGQRWRMVNDDPSSSFAVLRLLEFYAHGPASSRDLLKNNRLTIFLGKASSMFPKNTHVNILIGWLYVKQYKYKEAESFLKPVVLNDPNSSWAHTVLSAVAMYRCDSEQSVKEAQAAADLWPTSAYVHQTLSEAYASAATSARHGHYYADMTRKMERDWQRNSVLAYEEAYKALKLDPNNYDAWASILTTSRELGYNDYVRRAFREMTRINPKSTHAYIEYAFTFSPQWGGTKQEQEQILAVADNALGKDSADACYVRAYVMMRNVQRKDERPALLALADKAVARSDGKDTRILMLKCNVLDGLRRRAEVLTLAKKGFILNPSPSWRMLLARGFEFRWEDAHDPRALAMAYLLLKDYVDQIPNDPFGHDHLGWCLSHMGRRAEAKKEFETALALDPSDSLAKEKMSYVK